MRGGGRDRPVDQTGGHQRPRGVVDDDDVGGRSDLRERMGNRVLPACAPRDDDDPVRLQVRRRVVDQFARVMPSPAYLCVGASESLLRVTSRFELEELGGAFVYVKRR
jgi:hypothetical protein